MPAAPEQAGKFGESSDKARAIVARVRRKAQLRAPKETLWDEIARYYEPGDVGTFRCEGWSISDRSADDDYVFDSDHVDCRDNMVSVLDSLLTPLGKVWFRIIAPTDALNDDPETRDVCQQVSDEVWTAIQAPDANLIPALQAVYRSFANYGAGFVFIGPHYKSWGVRFVNIHIGECFPEYNHQGELIGMDRWFKMTAAEAVGMFGKKRIPKSIREALTQDGQENQKFSFIHCVRERDPDDYDPTRNDAKGKPYAAYYVSVADDAILDEEGFFTMPYVAALDRKGRDPWPRGAGERALPSTKLVQEMARTDLNAGQMAAEPAMMVPENAAFAFNLEPRAIIYGGVNREGKPLVHPFMGGDPRITPEKMQVQRDIIAKIFLNVYFQILKQNPQMTAAEVYDRARKESALMAPPIGQLQPSFLGRVIDRVIDVLSQLLRLPELSPALRERGGDYGLQWDSPITDAQKADESAGFVRGLSIMTDYITKTGDKSVTKVIHPVRGFRMLFRSGGTPEECLATDEEIAQQDEQAAAATERAQVAAEAPAAAQLLTAADKVTAGEEEAVPV